ncbi:AmmeMemoRadiSam system protein B, partial [bacterium]|nr:AmmeMemoRadiSam system protein B [bacterium]
ETPFGIAKVDNDKIKWFVEKAGEGITKDEFIHRSEHSVEFQVVLLQYLFGNDPEFEIVPVLCGRINESVMNGIEPIEIAEYKSVIEAMKEYVTSNDACVVAGADLSHIGPRFGDQQQVTPYILNMVDEEDHKNIDTFGEVDSKAFFTNIARLRNRWRVCGFSPILAQLYILEDCKGELIKYCQAKDPIASVTFCAYSFYKKRGE